LINKQPGPARIAIIGGGSWATALVKIFSENEVKLSWWIKNPEDVIHIQNIGINPKYLSNIRINLKKVRPTNDLKSAIEGVSMVVFAVPAAFIKDVLSLISKEDLKDKIIVSAIKGMIPKDNILVTEYLESAFFVPKKFLCVISGPCHSEEVALEKKSYLTIACHELSIGARLSRLLTCRFVKTTPILDVYGVEYCAVMKNVIAIACGVSHGLNYGDNFQAVLVSNAMQEIKSFLDVVYPMSRDLNASAYLGDLLVTTYSHFSRNRTLGSMVGRGYSVRSTQIEMNMVAEGYWAVKCVHEINKQHNIPMPITKAVYNILYEKISPAVEIRILEDVLK
jgi:glycerol-3-phosphate dehydrogenase (NAD(P)+)